MALKIKDSATKQEAILEKKVVRAMQRQKEQELERLRRERRAKSHSVG